MMSELEWMLPAIVFVPFAAAALALVLGPITARRTGLLMVGAAAWAFAAGLWLFIQSGHGETVAFNYNWIADLNIRFSLRGDSFGLFFALLVSGIGTLVGIYSLAYIPKLAPRRLGQYYCALIAFMGAMLGLSLSDDLILLFVFWEITSITSFILIGFWYEKDDARKGAMTALQVTVMGGLAMMVGFVLVGVITGTFSIDALAHDPIVQAKLTGSPLFSIALLLILCGAFTKSAQWPFHFWLPNAMVAPTPVSTYLHAATMVKAGIFLMGRLLPAFSTAVPWSPVLTTVGFITFSWTAFQALKETDLKAILARATLSTLGLVTMLYGLKAANQDALQIWSHGAYKGGLFLVAGIVEHATHTRDIRQLGGLKKYMPVTFWICVLAALSMAGLPPFFGFLAKEALYAELLDSPVLEHLPSVVQWLFIAVCVVANAFIFATAFKLIIGVFLGKPGEAVEHAHRAEKGLWIPAAILAGSALVVGLLGFTDIPGHLVANFSSNGGEDLHVSLIPTHWGPLLLSLATIGLGVLIYRSRVAVNRVQYALDAMLPTMQSLWDRFISSITWAAVAYSSRWQNGSLRWYFSIVLVFVVSISSYALWSSGLSLKNAHVDLSQMQWHGLALCVLLAVAAVAVVRSRTRLGASITLTATGFLTALLFVTYRSPDILLTQILIETVSTIFILLILFFMPPFKPDGFTAVGKLVNLAIAVAVGVTMFTFVLLTTSDHFRQKANLAGQYLSRSLGEAGGANAVNVIIVDFRAIDTTGEITVLVIVGLCVFSMLRTRRKSA